MELEPGDPNDTDYSAIWSCEDPEEFVEAIEEVRLSVDSGDYTVEDAMEELDAIAHDLALSREIHPEYTDQLTLIRESFTELRNSIFY